MSEHPEIRQLTIRDGTWLVVTAVYATPVAARKAWEQIERKSRSYKGEPGGVGIYRHSVGSIEGRLVSVVGLMPDAEARVQRVQRVLANMGGEDYRLGQKAATDLIARRARVVLAKAGEGAGRVVTRRPDARGATLMPDGRAIEHKPGQG